MSRFGMVAAVVLAGLAAQALAQSPTQIAVMEGDAAAAYKAVGVVSVEMAQAAMGSNAPREQLDKALRAEATKLGADAVIQVTYQITNALTDKQVYLAKGVAVRFTPAAVAKAPVEPAPQVILPPTPPALATAPSFSASGPPVVVAAAPPAPAAAPVRRVTVAAAIVLSEQDIAGQYERIGEVTAVTHQKSMFPKTPPMDELRAALQAEAARVGADAVIQVKFRMRNAMTSKEGNTATGVAVRYKAASAAPVTAAAAPGAPVAAPSVATAPSVAVASAPPAPAPAAPAVAAALRHATSPAMVVLTEKDMAGQRYVRLGEVSAVTHQKSMFPKTPPIETLKTALQGEAHRMGADAVIQVKYSMSNAMMSKDGNKAVGIAVRFE